MNWDRQLPLGRAGGGAGAVPALPSGAHWAGTMLFGW
jgi:hypothetical protein